VSNSDLRRSERLLKALANRRRLAILKYLKKNREAPVTDLSYAIPLSFKATSKHLAVLAAVDIIDKEQRGLQVFYRLATPLPSEAKHIVILL